MSKALIYHLYDNGRYAGDYTAGELHQMLDYPAARFSQMAILETTFKGRYQFVAITDPVVADTGCRCDIPVAILLDWMATVKYVRRSAARRNVDLDSIRLIPSRNKAE